MELAEILSVPFTPTHIAAILPVAFVARRALPFSALVVGSMIPDLPLFVPLPPTYDTTHSIRGVFSACLPLGMTCFLAFQCLLKRPLIALLPDIVRRRCAFLSTSRVEPTFRSFASASVAIVIGATSHVFWDSFTHRGRWGSRLAPRLNDVVLTIAGHDVPGYKALQYGCTLVLLPCLGLASVIWLSRQRPGSLGGLPALPKSWRVAVYLITLVIPALVTLVIEAWSRGTRYAKLGQSITLSGLALGVFFLAYSVSYQATLGRAPRPE